jgi:hypothetical protein
VHCGGILFEDSTWRPNNPTGKYPYECEPPPGIRPTQVIGDDFQLGPQPGGCARFKTAPSTSSGRTTPFGWAGTCTS